MDIIYILPKINTITEIGCIECAYRKVLHEVGMVELKRQNDERAFPLNTILKSQCDDHPFVKHDTGFI